MGFGEHFAYKSSEEIFDEIRRFSNPKTGYDLRGASYDAAARDAAAVALPARATTTTATRSATSTTGSARTCSSTPTGTGRGWRSPRRRGARCSTPARTWIRDELPDDDFPLVLNTGRLQHQWHTMTKTGKVAKLNKLDSGPFVEIHPDDAAGARHRRRRPVELTSRRGRAVLPAVVTDRVRPGDCFVPFHWNDEHGEYLTVNAVTNDAVDPDSLQPEFKVCAVRLRRRVDPVPAPAARVDDDEVYRLVDRGSETAPLVLWASQTGNCRGVSRAAVGADRIGAASQLSRAMDDAGVLAGAWRPAARRGRDRHQHVRRRRAAGQRRRLLGSPRLARRARAGRRALCGARHRRPVLRRLLRTRQVARRQVHRPRRDQDARPRRVRGLRRRADAAMGGTGRRRCSAAPAAAGSRARNRADRSPGANPLRCRCAATSC